jgi:hypothetical protein
MGTDCLVSIIQIYDIAVRLFFRDPAFYLGLQASILTPAVASLLYPSKALGLQIVALILAAFSYPIMLQKLRAHFYREVFDFTDAFSVCFTKFIPSLMSVALAAIISVLGLLLLVFPGVKWALDYTFVPIACYLEKSTPNALKLSKSLMYGNHFKLIGLVITWVLIILPIFYFIPNPSVLSQIRLNNFILFIPILLIPTLVAMTFGVFYFDIRTHLPARDIYLIPGFHFFKTILQIIILYSAPIGGWMAANQYMPNQIQNLKSYVPGIRYRFASIIPNRVSHPTIAPTSTPTAQPKPASTPAVDSQNFMSHVLKATATANSIRYKGEITKLKWAPLKNRFVLEFDKYSSSHMFSVLDARNNPTLSNGIHMVHEGLLSCVRQRQTHACSLGLDIDDPKIRDFYKKRNSRLPMSVVFTSYSRPKGSPNTQLGIGFYFFNSAQKTYFGKMKIQNVVCDLRKPICGFVM